MPEISQHVETMLSYTDLQTTDPGAAKEFYAELFGWEVTELPMGDGQFYVQFKKGGKTVAGASEQQQQQRDSGTPPMWNTYFTVLDVDNRTKEAERAGGTILVEPFDVFDAGRMSVIADPNGAVFSLWQAKEDIGAQVMNEHATLTWAECMGTDVEKGRAFYTDLFAWDPDVMQSPTAGPYIVFRKDGQAAAGLMGVPDPAMRSSWLNYFFVDNCDDAVAKVRELGGGIMRPTTPIPGVGRFAVVGDPQGAVFGLLEPEPQH